MTAKLSTPQPKFISSKSAKVTAYKTVGRTSDGVFVLKPKAATSHPTALGTKVAYVMAKSRGMTGAAATIEVATADKRTPAPNRKRTPK